MSLPYENATSGAGALEEIIALRADVEALRAGRGER